MWSESGRLSLLASTRIKRRYRQAPSQLSARTLIGSFDQWWILLRRLLRPPDISRDRRP